MKVTDYLYLNHNYFTQDVKYSDGVEIQFMLDTGASASIINYATYKQLQKINSVMMINTSDVLRTANNDPMSIFGTCQITLFYDLQKEYSVVHKFYICSQNENTNNLIGIDFISKECQSINIASAYFTHGKYKRTVKLLTKSEKDYPFCSYMNKIDLQNDRHFEPRSNRFFKFANKPKFVKVGKLVEYIILFVPLEQTKRSQLNFISTTNSPVKDHFLLMIENETDHKITLEQGPFGFLVTDLGYRNLSNYTKYSVNNFTEFIGQIATQLHPDEIQKVPVNRFKI